MLLEEVKEKIAEIEVDDRYQAKPALVEVNAPLAIIQMNLKGRLEVLRWIEERLQPVNSPDTKWCDNVRVLNSEESCSYLGVEDTCLRR